MVNLTALLQVAEAAERIRLPLAQLSLQGEKLRPLLCAQAKELSEVLPTLQQASSEFQSATSMLLEHMQPHFQHLSLLAERTALMGKQLEASFRSLNFPTLDKGSLRRSS